MARVTCLVLLVPTAYYVARKIYECTYLTWSYGPSTLGGVIDAGVHSDHFLPLVGVVLLGLTVLAPTSLFLVSVSQRPNKTLVDRFTLCIGVTALVVLGLGAMPVSLIKRTTWAVAGAGPGGVIEMIAAAERCDVATFELLEARGALEARAHALSALNGGGRAFGRVAIVRAASAGCLPIVDSLLAYGVDANACDRSGKTALEVARVDGQEEIEEALLRAGARETGR